MQVKSMPRLTERIFVSFAIQSDSEEARVTVFIDLLPWEKITVPRGPSTGVFTQTLPCQRAEVSSQPYTHHGDN